MTSFPKMSDDDGDDDDDDDGDDDITVLTAHQHQKVGRRPFGPNKTGPH